MRNSENKGGVFKIVAIIGVILLASFLAKPLFEREAKLRVYAPADINPELVDSAMQTQSGDHRIKDFELYNQKNQLVNKSSFQNKIKIVDFFFTTCPNICPKMTFQMERINERFVEDTNFVILSHSVTPTKDTPEVLAQYAKDHGASLPKWQFLTGDKQIINTLARQSYFAAKEEWKGDYGEFIHTENFVLVDPNWRIRGYYDGTNTQDVDRLMKEYKILKEEFEVLFQ
mgnify:CR=1 FL=1